MKCQRSQKKHPSSYEILALDLWELSQKDQISANEERPLAAQVRRDIGVEMVWYLMEIVALNGRSRVMHLAVPVVLAPGRFFNAAFHDQRCFEVWPDCRQMLSQRTSTPQQSSFKYSCQTVHQVQQAHTLHLTCAKILPLLDTNRTLYASGMTANQRSDSVL